jgi:hypothetical protein
LAISQFRQQLSLAAGVGGIGGGVLLLATNLAFLAMAPVAALPWVPLSANVALIFGGLMFVREYRRRKAE